MSEKWSIQSTQATPHISYKALRNKLTLLIIMIELGKIEKGRTFYGISVKCPHCLEINKHGLGDTRNEVISMLTSRQCDWCPKEYDLNDRVVKPIYVPY